jgi:hypothetical protein
VEELEVAIFSKTRKSFPSLGKALLASQSLDSSKVGMNHDA